ncbi:MAG: dTMP kinase [Legionella sp.]
MPRGHFIVVEGLEGAGKSTALATIKQYFIKHNLDFIMTREPGGTIRGEAIRTIIKEVVESEPLEPQAELLLFYAARVQLLRQVILPALQRGSWVLADRFELSTLAYQGGGRKLDPHFITQLSRFCLGDFKPDLMIFLDIPPHIGLQRVRKRGKFDRIEQESLEFFNCVYECYHQHIRTLNNVVIIDAAQPLVSVKNAIRETLDLYLRHDV